jgi:hypothetical protein
MFGDVSTHLGCLQNPRPHWGMSYECIQVGSELILHQVPIILPLTEILTVPVSQKQISTMSHAAHDHRIMLKKNDNDVSYFLHLPLTIRLHMLIPCHYLLISRPRYSSTQSLCLKSVKGRTWTLKSGEGDFVA